MYFEALTAFTKIISGAEHTSWNTMKEQGPSSSILLVTSHCQNSTHYQISVCSLSALEAGSGGRALKRSEMKAGFTENKPVIILHHRSPHPYRLLQIFITQMYCLTSQVDSKDKLIVLQLTGNTICRPASRATGKHITCSGPWLELHRGQP